MVSPLALLRNPVHASSMVGCLTVFVCLYRVQRRNSKVLQNDKRVVCASVGALGVFLWPAALRLASPSDAVGCVRGSVWLLAMWLFDMSVMTVVKDPRTKGVDFDKHALTGLAFSLAGRSGCRGTKEVENLMTLAVATCFLAVTPTHELPEDSVSAWVVDSIQNVMLRWCVAMVITAV